MPAPTMQTSAWTLLVKLGKRGILAVLAHMDSLRAVSGVAW
jgi:hypothetical protein